MATVLLLLVYLAFVSLGLPDALVGAAWPVMRDDLNAPLGGAGLIAMVVSAGTILSSFLSGFLTRRFGVIPVVLISIALTALALFGFSLSASLAVVCVCAVPLGLGAGAVDSILNAYVAARYAARHMNWLHCFWGLGAVGGSLVIAASIASGGGWQGGYFAVACVQAAVLALLALSVPLWRRGSTAVSTGRLKENETRKDRPSAPPLGKTRVAVVLLAFFSYMTVEATAGLWGGSYLVGARGVSEATAAALVALYFGGITAGRLLSGLISIRLSNRMLIRIGCLFCCAGVLLLSLPGQGGWHGQWAPAAGLACLGLGCAPVFPALLHETPRRFGEEAARLLMGVQMGVAYTATALMPPLFGLIAQTISVQWLPLFLAAAVAALLVATEIEGKNGAGAD